MAGHLSVGRRVRGPPAWGGLVPRSIKETLGRGPQLRLSHAFPWCLALQEILSACWAFDLQERPSFPLLMDMLEKLPKLNRRLSHPGHFWKSAE